MATWPAEPVFDVAVVGAGPAGMAAAVTAADAGRAVVMLDLADRVGGQYYRHASPRLGARRPGAFHHGWSTFVRLRERFEAHERAGRITHRPRNAVWGIEAGDVVAVRSVEGEREPLARETAARTLVVACGAHDRHVPFPGWTLPGVIAVGGAQALLKGSLVAAGRRAVIAGTGPFLLSVADGLLAAGVDVAEVLEANAPWAYARRPHVVVGAAAKVPEALRYAAGLARHRVPYRPRHAVVAAHGDGRLEAVTVSRVDDGWGPVPGTERQIACDTLAVGYGFTPQLELLLQAGCETDRSADGSLVAVVAADQRTSVEGIYAAGEATGVGGADLALAEGTLAGAAAARSLTGAWALEEAATRRLLGRRRRLRRFAELLQAVHPVPDGWAAWLRDDTLVCRCEEVRYGRVREAVLELGATDPRTVKLLARPGMGWCQGRICGTATATLTAVLGGRQVTREDLEGMARRPIGQPIPLAALAALDAAARRAA